LGDHVTRYEWASFFCEGKVVLDIPCGTGYGSKLINNTPHYYGMDLDAASIEWAKTHYTDGSQQFEVGDMTDIPLPSNSVDQILCFEGLEHVEDQAAVVSEFHRVLRPGANFIISTPQAGVAGGTPWDRYMLTWDELVALFPPEMWEGLDPFYQVSYGQSPVQEGVPPNHAQIMILGGTKVK
jgi:ubiquinone/menaquinone biosynthesis C-methylase UbiE